MAPPAPMAAADRRRRLHEVTGTLRPTRTVARPQTGMAVLRGMLALGGRGRAATAGAAGGTTIGVRMGAVESGEGEGGRGRTEAATSEAWATEPRMVQDPMMAAVVAVAAGCTGVLVGQMVLCAKALGVTATRGTGATDEERSTRRRQRLPARGYVRGAVRGSGGSGGEGGWDIS